MIDHSINCREGPIPPIKFRTRALFASFTSWGTISVFMTFMTSRVCTTYFIKHVIYMRSTYFFLKIKINIYYFVPGFYHGLCDCVIIIKYVAWKIILARTIYMTIEHSWQARLHWRSLSTSSLGTFYRFVHILYWNQWGTER